MSEDPGAMQDVLRGASDGLLFAIHEVAARERLKRDVSPGDPGFPALAREVRIAAEAVLVMARAEETTAQEISDRAASVGLPPINESQPLPDLAAILGEWRSVERRLEAAEPASPEALGLMEEFEELRDRYAQALQAHQRKR